MAELELESTKCEYDGLLIEKENLVEKISKAQEENGKIYGIHNPFQYKKV